MDLLTRYHSAQQLFSDALMTLPDDPWKDETACADWTVADIVGHVTWGQDLIAALATRTAFTDRTGAPGTGSPTDYLQGDPRAAWQRARNAATVALTPATITVPLPEGMSADPGATIGTFAGILAFDLLVHAWDVTHRRSIPLAVPEPLLTGVAETASQVVTRRPGFFGPEVTPPAEADPLTTLMAFCGREPQLVSS